MAGKLMIGTVVFLLAIIVGFQELRSNQELKERARRGRVPAAIEDAKPKNEMEAKVRAPIGYYASVKSVEEALAHYSTVIAQPVDQVTKLSTDGKEIETWFKFKADYLSQPTQTACKTCLNPQLIPPELQPLQQDEFVLRRGIGTIESNGVTVTSFDDDFPSFKHSQKYFMFVSLNPTTGVASLELGPEGVSLIETNGNLSPLSPRHQTLTGRLRASYGDIKGKTGLGLTVKDNHVLSRTE